MMRLTVPLPVLAVLASLFSMALASSQAYAQPVFSASFSPNQIGPGSTSTLRYDIDNSISASPVVDLNFSNTLPAGLVIADAAGIVTDCVNGLVTATAGGGQIDFNNARLFGGERCFVQLEVTSSTVGTTTNITGTLNSSQGSSGSAMADLTVLLNRPGFSQSFTPAIVSQGHRTRLTYLIDNTANPSNIFNITFRDDLTPGLRVADPADSSTTCTGGVLSVTPGSFAVSFGPLSNGSLLLAAGATCTVSLDIEAVGAGLIENLSGDLSATSAGPLQSAGHSAAALDITLSEHLLTSKVFNADPVIAGDSVQLTYRIFNRERLFTASNISFTDDLTTALSGLQATGLPLTDICGAGSILNGVTNLSLTGGSLNPEESCEFSVTLQTPSTAAVGAYPSVTSLVSGLLAGQAISEPPASDTLFISDAPSISKQFLTNPVGAGAATTLEFTLTNNNPVSSATNISFNDNLEAFLPGVIVTALPASGFCGAGSTIAIAVISAFDTLIVDGANLGPGATCTFSVDLLLPDNTAAGQYLNTTTNVLATVAGLSQQGQAANASLQVLAAPQLRISFTNNPLDAGDIANLHVDLSLSEEAALATDIQFMLDLTAALPGLTAIGLPLNAICGATSQVSGTTLLSFSGGVLNPGSSCSFDINLQTPAAANLGSYTLTSTTLSAQVAGLPVFGQAASSTLLLSNIQFTKAFIDNPVLPGQLTTLRFTIDNSQGSDILSNISFNDSLSGTLSGLSAQGLPLLNPCGAGSQITGGSNLTFTGGNLAANSGCSFDVNVLVPAAAANGSYINTTSNLNLTIAGSMVSLPAASNILVINDQQLQLEMSFNPSTVVAGSMVDLDFTLSNLSAGAVDSIGFTDDLNATLPGLNAVNTPQNDLCGLGSSLSGSGMLSFSGGSLAAGASCNFSVSLQVPLAATAGIATNNTSVIQGNLAGNSVFGAAASADVRVSRLTFSKSFANPVVTGQTTTLTYTITNLDPAITVSGLRFSDNLDAVLSGLNATNSVQTNICGTGSQLSGTALLSFDQGSLAPGASCSFNVTVLVPAGLLPGSFTSISSDLTQSGLSVAAAAQADLQVLGQAILSLNTNGINFGDVRVGTSSGAMLVNVSNTGTADLDVQMLSGLLAPFSLNGGDCPALPFNLGLGSNCNLGVVFNPVIAGPVNQSLNLTSNALSSPDTISLQGNGIRPLLNLSSASLDFGVTSIGQTSPSQSIVLSNGGDADLNVTSIDTASAPFNLVASTCGVPPFVLAPAASCSLQYQFMPLVVGAVSRNLNIVSDAVSSPDIFTLQGEGAQALIVLDRSEVDFGVRAIGESSHQLLLLSNTGTADLTIDSFTGPVTPFAILNGSCGNLPIVLLPSSSCELEVSFAPFDAEPAMGQFSINSNANNASPLVSLRGQGIFIVAVPGLSRFAMLILFLLLCGSAWSFRSRLY